MLDLRQRAEKHDDADGTRSHSEEMQIVQMEREGARTMLDRAWEASRGGGERADEE